MMQLKKNREYFLPWIKDWTSDQEKIRNSHPADLNLRNWLFCHPSSYKIARYSGSGLSVVLSISILLWAINRENILFIIVSAVCFAIYTAQIVKMFYTRQLWSRLTFYDLYMRDWPEDKHEGK